MMSGKTIPSTNYVTSNQRIMATIQTAPLTKDCNIGVGGFFSPTKGHSSILNSSRVKLVIDNEIYEPYDDEERSVVTERKYIKDTNIICITWESGGILVKDKYYIPPELDVLVHEITVQNNTASGKSVKLYGFLETLLGAKVDYRKGVCEEAYYDKDSECIIIASPNGDHIVYGFDRTPSEYQIGEVCGKTDVYFDLEDKTLSGNERLERVVANGAIGVDFGVLEPQAMQAIRLCIGRADSAEAAKEQYRAFCAGKDTFLESVKTYWSSWLSKGASIGTVEGLDERVPDLFARGKVVLKYHQTEEGVLFGGSNADAYQGAIQARNSCYSQRCLDRLGYHDEAEMSYELFTEFKVGDNRFSSADENDQLGTIIHCFFEHYKFTRDIAFLKKHYAFVSRFANALVDMIDPHAGLIYSERSIHEYVRISRGFETYVNVMAYRGIADAASIAATLDNQQDEKCWSESAGKLQQAILDKLYCPTQRTFVKRLYQGKRDTLPAVSMITPALFGVIDAKDERVSSTLDYVMQHIWDKEIGGLYRYPLKYQPWDEIPFGGPWVTYTSWLCRVYIKRGELDKARQCINWVVENSPIDTNTIPEHFSVKLQNRRGFHRVYTTPTVPETWATAEFIMAVLDYQEAIQA
jgi:GH15 family glucan-1,4-alpha-glucosidase